MPQPGRRVETVLFLDMVGSTSVAAQLGDARWREVLTRFNRIVRAVLKRFGGHEEDTAGDGYFVTFSQPGQAVRCACSIAERVRDLGLEVRSGLHTGETESIDGKRGGLGVVIGARVMSLGGPGEVLVTSTTKQLVTGAGLEFEDLSAHELKGVPGTWQVFAVSSVDGRELGAPLTADEAVQRFERIHPTPFVRRRSSAIGAGVGVALLAAVVVIVLTTGGTPPSNAVREPSPITILRVDPTSNVVGPALRSGVQSLHMPGAIFYDGSSLWQAAPPEEAPSAFEDGKLLRRDASTGEVLETQPVDIGDVMIFAFGYAWVAHDEAVESSLDKIDPASGRTIATVKLPGGFIDVAAGPRTLWYLSSQGDLVEIDPITAKVDHRFRVDVLLPGRVVPLLGYVWICACDEGKILRFDPRKRKVTETVELEQHGFLVGVDTDDGNTMWLVDPDAGTITSLDARSGESGRPLGFGGGNFYDAKIRFGSIWVAAGSVLFRFDLADGSRREIPMPTGASAGGAGAERGRRRRLGRELRLPRSLVGAPQTRVRGTDPRENFGGRGRSAGACNQHSSAAL